MTKKMKILDYLHTISQGRATLLKGRNLISNISYFEFKQEKIVRKKPKCFFHLQGTMMASLLHLSPKCAKLDFFCTPMQDSGRSSVSYVYL